MPISSVVELRLPSDTDGKLDENESVCKCVRDVLAKSNGRKCEHLLQRMRPQRRQWCRRRVSVKWRPHVMHSDTSESGAQVTMDFSNAAFTQSHAQQTYITNTNANYPVCVCVWQCWRSNSYTYASVIKKYNLRYDTVD